MSHELICGAINSQNLIEFQYDHGSDPGLRLVEPHMVAFNAAGNLSLSAWFLSGSSESGGREGWREYLISGISRVKILPETFEGARPGYNASGGKKFHDIQCAI